MNGKPVDPSQLDRFTDALAHRGPDGRGTHVDAQASLGLGHRRLAILDLSPSGSQPMSYGDGRYWITYNGEIYNFLEIRDRLRQQGYAFRTESDTEVILAAYDHWGEECQLQFNGMWAFAIWDGGKQTLFLSRDRFGVKPLHYAWDGDCFLFASEMKAFLTIRGFDKSFDPHVMAAAIDNPHAIEASEYCLLRRLRRLRGGHCLTMKKGHPPVVRRWWNTLDHLVDVPEDFANQTSRFREIFFDACRIRMRSDVPIGTSLSGGMDSSSVLCSMATVRKQSPGDLRQAGDWQRAFIATFTGTSQDERRYADEAVAKAKAIALHREISPADTLEHLDDVIYQFEEIYYGTCLEAWLIYREQRRGGVYVTLDGHGGDELLGGYHHHIPPAMADAFLGQQPARMRDLWGTARGLYRDRPTSEATILQHMLRQAGYSFLKEVSFRFPSSAGLCRKIASATQRRWLKIEPPDLPLPQIAADRGALERHDSLFRALYYDCHATTLPTMLRNYDRSSMAHGVEVRIPFLDWRLVCYAFSLPSVSKVGVGFTKRVLREAMRGILPESVRRRTGKMGFASPFGEWLNNDDLKSRTLDAVRGGSFLQSDIWDGPTIASAVERALVVERALAEKRWGEIVFAWRFIQADRLMKLFGKRGVHD